MSTTPVTALCLMALVVLCNNHEGSPYEEGGNDPDESEDDENNNEPDEDEGDDGDEGDDEFSDKPRRFVRSERLQRA